MRASAIVLVSMSLLALAPPTPAASVPDVVGLCPELAIFPGTGLACLAPNGLLHAYGPNGLDLGFTHGPDRLIAGGGAGAASRAPHCVSGAAGTYYVRVVYARASDDTDNYNTMLTSIRALLNQTNAVMDAAAQVQGGHADLNVYCTGGLVDVADLTLPTAMASASFDTIAADLQAQGVGDSKVKTLVYYDAHLSGANASYGGQGNIYGDDRDVLANANNGGGIAEFAIDYGYTDANIFSHELGHNLGAVQLSAAHTTGAWHCTDGFDTMCYNDGGPTGGAYTTTACASTVYDCNADDYFNAAPAAGSYLGTHWNIGSGLSRYLLLSGLPVIGSWSCADARASVGRAESCSITTNDTAAAGVSATIDWGDGTTTRVPTLGTFSANSTQTFTHTWSSVGTFTLVATVTDDQALPHPGAPRRLSEVVQGAPSTPALSCGPSPAINGQTVTCSFSSSDDSSGVYYQVDWGDGASSRVPSSGVVAPGGARSATHSYATGGATYGVRVNATDNEAIPLTSPSATASESITQNAAPVMRALSCAPSTARVGTTLTCSVSASDDSSGVAYTIAWGDGATTRVPASGFAAPSSTLTATHTWSAPATYAVSASATDNSYIPATSSALSVNVTITPDLAPTVTWLTCATTREDIAASCAFNASDDSPGIAYTIDWGDGAAAARVPASGFVAPGTNTTAWHTWTPAGNYTVRVSATDNDGALTSATASFVETVVANQAPTMQAVSCSPGSPTATQIVTCTLRATDESSVNYRIDWADGSTPSSSGYVASGTSFPFTHAYATDATYTLRATATDDAPTPLTSSAMTVPLVVVPNRAPVVMIWGCNTWGLDPGVSQSCAVNATDESPLVFYTLDWGDGTSTRVPGSGLVSPGPIQWADHAWANPGDYTIAWTATDNGGLASAPVTHALTVRNPNAMPQIQAFDCPAQVTQQLAFTCSINASDDSTGVSYAIDWNDGTSALVPASGFRAPNASFTLLHAYIGTGTFHPTLTVTDNGPWTRPQTMTIAIASKPDITPPVLSVSDPRPNLVYHGCGSTVNTQADPLGRATFVQTACVVASAEDESGIAAVNVYLNDVLVASGTQKPYRFQFPVDPAEVAFLDVQAIDKWGNVASWSAPVTLI